jgi:indole-3-glycerol phosphate synthase
VSDFLRRMADSSRVRLTQAREETSLTNLRSRSLAAPPRPLPDSPFHLFAEVKPVSPALGPLGSVDFEEMSRAYCSGGATAISVLTEPSEFGGSLNLLSSVAGISTVPVMRKDFIVDPYQVWEGRASGADGVLAIARILDASQLSAIAGAAGEAGMFLLIELFDESDLELLQLVDMAHGTILIGVNCRDLETLAVRPGLHERMINLVPDHLPVIAESGIDNAKRVRELAEMGYDGALIGTSLMRSAHPASLLGEMRLAAAGAVR